MTVLLALSAALFLTSQTPLELANKAETLIRAGHAPDAFPLLEQAANAPGATAESEDRIGFLLAVLGRSADALGHFQKSISLNADYAPAHYHLGAALFVAKDYSRGLPELQAAVKLTPTSFDYRYRLGCGYMAMGDFEKAAVELKQSAALDSTRPEAWSQLGIALRRRGDLVGAVDAYARAVKLKPQDDDLRNSYAAMLVQTRQAARALEESQKVLTRDGSTPAARINAHMNMGYAYLNTGEFEKSETAYRAAVALDPA